MKIIVTSDLHYGITDLKTIQKLVDDIADEKPDGVAIAGDIADGGISSIQSCLEQFSKLKIPIYVIPGNHDLWAYDSVSSVHSMLYQIKNVVLNLNMIWLEDSIGQFNNVGLVGSYLHYDYSAKDKVGPCSLFPDDYLFLNKINLNNDARMMRGVFSDIDFAHELGSAFSDRLKKADVFDKVIIITHVSCMECQMTRNPYRFDWSSGTPYFGNLSHESEILSNPKIVAVVSGHSHRGNANLITRPNMPDIQVINLGSDYNLPVYCVLNL